MNKNKIKIKIKKILEYICPSFVLSYFFIHNIFFVIIGILLSIYLINVHKVESFINFININRCGKGLLKNTKNINVRSDSKPIKMNLENEDSNLTLVEIIEESGFIPSTDKKKDMNAA